MHAALVFKFNWLKAQMSYLCRQEKFKKKKREKETKHIIQFLLHSPTTTNQQS